ncbi:MAG: (2Fe-2S)-binding protein [Planctomycetes bacterium]|nr:(2Fe-2S)-binding protein [Planctomycetota bacterium]
MPKIKFIKEKKEIEVPEGANLRKEALKAGIEVYPGIHKKWFANCHGNGICCSCRVHVKKGQENVSKPGIWEKFNCAINPFGFFSKLGHEQELRLSCQTKVYGDCEVETRPEFNWHGEKFWG